MPGPYLLQRASGHQILTLILVPEQGHESFQELDRSTWNIQRALRLGLVHHAALRRACTRIAARAAGVIPLIRPAAPRVAGRAADSRSTISLERPAMAA